MCKLISLDAKINNLYCIYDKIGAKNIVFEKNCILVKEVELKLFEEKYVTLIPNSFKKYLTTYARSFKFNAMLPNSLQLPFELKELYAANFSWSFDDLPNLESKRMKWIEECFFDCSDEYNKIWHNKLAFMETPNGDLIAFDLNDTKDDKRIMYLSHDENEGHGYILAENFNAFINRIIKIGGIGNEIWQYLCFIENFKYGIDTDCINAIKYRNLIGL